MNLKALGLNEWIKQNTAPEKLADFWLARIIAVDKDSYVIRGELGEFRAELTGKFMYSTASPLDYPTVGDWVYAQMFDDDSFAVIHELIARQTILQRKTSGQKIEHQLIAANIDTALIVQSLDGNFNIQRLERYLAIAAQSNIRPVILLSKSDLLSQDDVSEKLLEINALMPDLITRSFSNSDNAGLADVRELMIEGRTHCLLGSSGVGKTTLLNNLLGQEAFETQSIREKDSKGRHTTTRRQLIVLDGGAIIIDTPGMRELGTIGVESGIDSTFNEIADLSARCRFKDCSHTHEKSCAVLAALDDGTIEKRRYDNYIKMIKESRHYSMSIQERRSKDKDFGKMVKSVMKNKRKRH